MIFAMILYETLRKEIILNLEKEVAFSSLGISAKKDELDTPSILEYFWMYWIILTRSNFKICQHFL
jgi:hypothetical protein